MDSQEEFEAWYHEAYEAGRAGLSYHDGYVDGHAVGRVAERQRIRQLAIDRHAKWQPRAYCSCGRTMPNGEQCWYETGPPSLFADLLGDDDD